MTDENTKVAVRKRSVRMYWAWGIAMTLLLALGALCWAVAVPVCEVHAALKDFALERSTSTLHRFPKDLEPTVERLGGHERATGPLCLYLRLPDKLAVHKALAIEALAVCPQAQAIPTLISALDHEDETIRAAAAMALAHYGSKAKIAVGPLTTSLDDSSATVRMFALTALAEIGPDARQALPKLLESLEDPDDVVRLIAAKAVLHMGHDETGNAIPVLEALLCDKNVGHRGLAAEILIKHGGANNKGMAWAIKSLAPDQERMDRQFAAITLQRLGPLSAPAVPALTRALSDKEPRVRHAAATALGKIGSPALSAVPALEELLKDKDDRVRQAASEALAKIRVAQEQKL